MILKQVQEVLGEGEDILLKCWNCGEWGHISPQCDKLVRMGGDMYPIMHKENDRTGDYVVEVKEASKPSSSKSVS